MKRKLFATTLVALLLMTTVAVAQGPAPDLSWWTIDNGGGLDSSGGSFQLSGTIGQPEAGVLTGGPYRLLGGWWDESTSSFAIYLPLVLKASTANQHRP